ncbi:undecaprenyl-diphosphatase [Alicyclobacillus tolerans]|uniref:undecaprenyl-diphosphatase n=1 Tax=Alicyclobacillus tolerans TaxID=90970 RepID=UPI001F322D5A|nr:undecaprenyl-diphosphatase [Alicyclobacillus tolerans]MCF8568214.1 undecaprenyl-diphosphatase [Alicyclobacillus tolerans]
MIHSAFLNPFDVTLYHLINGLAGHSPLLDAIMIFFAKDALEIYAVLFVVAWFALPKKDIQNRHALVVAGFAGVLALIINVILSHIWFRPRPFTVFQKGTFTQLIPHASDASFPSDHASGSFGFAAGSWGRQQKWISYTFTIIAIIVMIARVFVGVHYPSDVIGGLIVGVISGKVMWKFSRFLFPLTTFVAKLFKFGPSAKVGKHARSTSRSIS